MQLFTVEAGELVLVCNPFMGWRMAPKAELADAEVADWEDLLESHACVVQTFPVRAWAEMAVVSGWYGADAQVVEVGR